MFDDKIIALVILRHLSRIEGCQLIFATLPNVMYFTAKSLSKMPYHFCALITLQIKLVMSVLWLLPNLNLNCPSKKILPN